MQKKIIIFFVMLLVAGFYFVQDASADLPTLKGLGEPCYSSDECDTDLCSDGGTCVECMPGAEEACDEQLDTCDRGVCVRRGGNGVTSLCRFDNQCASGNCGDNNLCLAAGEQSEDVGNRVGGEDDWMGIDLTIQDVFAIISGLACWFSRVAVFLMVIFIILAGLRFMNARGDPAAFTVAKKNFGHVLIGLLVIMGVYVIIATVANAVGITDFSFIPLVC